MKAQETELKNMLDGTRQYVIPLYQRAYAWTKTEWKPFWQAVVRQYENVLSGTDTGSNTHFMGSLVVHPHPGVAHGVSYFDVIDGQQRLTSAYILLIALRDRWDEQNFQRVDATYLRNVYETGDSQYKLLPGEKDRADLINLLKGTPENASGRVREAYRYFANELDVLAETKQLNLSSLETALLSRLEVVDITVDATDNAHRIFQTLNSTGRSLSQVDLIRNHFFMLLPLSANEAYVQHWKPVETALGSSIDLFFWTELITRGAGLESTPRDGVYLKWSQILAEAEGNEETVLNHMQTLANHASVFSQIVDPSNASNSSVRFRLERLVEWGANVHYPLTLQTLLALDSGAISSADAAESLLLIESFMVRRMLAGVPTNNLNRIFTTTTGQVPAESGLKARLHESLSAANKLWPSDEELMDGAVHRDFYRSQKGKQRNFILRRIEEALGKEVPNWETSTYTIEHVMPQTLSFDWLKQLGPGAEEEHHALVHTLGNLTLTTANSELSNHPMSRKKEILQDSYLKLNHQLLEGEDPSWTFDKIADRSHRLAEICQKIWPGPLRESSETSSDWKSAITTQLASLTGGQWTTLEDLADESGAVPSDVRAFLIATPPTGYERVLTSTGGIDTTLPWVSTDIQGYKSKLVALGVLSSLDSSHAAPDNQSDSD